ncbi:MAG TPA: GNAT family N-acetyltransferase [Chitinophagaceae bacterium]|nr:GNAT family N-acetyltransferase [Chitinophagaceae bacterium]
MILHKYLDVVQLYCIRLGNQIAGFLGTSADKIEMLFVDPAYRGQSVGKQLLLYSIQHLKKSLADVNEQNDQAVGFYKHFGFVVIDRSEKDGMGKPYPILHIQLQA